MREIQEATNLLMEALNRARYVHHDPELGIAITWHGGTTFNVWSTYAGNVGQCVDCFTLSDEKGEPVGLDKAITAIEKHANDATWRE